MAKKTWHEALADVKPFIFKIATPDGYGTGFQIVYPTHAHLCAVATAYHVIDHADEWEESIKITHHVSNKSLVLKKEDRVIIPYPANDLAFIFFDKSLLPVMEKREPKLMDPEKILKDGVEIAWCGFPSIAPTAQLCFFAGHISSCISKEDYYLVDGVAINGVSGGPAFYSTNEGDVKICGLVSEYKLNRIYGEARPGLVKVCSVEPFQEMLKNLHTKEAAEEKAKEEKEKQIPVVDGADIPPQNNGDTPSADNKKIKQKKTKPTQPKNKSKAKKSVKKRKLN